MKKFFPDIQQTIPFEGPESKNPLAFKYYNPQQVVGQKTMKDHLRFSVAYWHTFKASGMDPFGAPTFVPAPAAPPLAPTNAIWFIMSAWKLMLRKTVSGS